MVEGRRCDDWAHTSHVLAMLVNTSANRDPKKSPASAATFDPMQQGQRKPGGVNGGDVIEVTAETVGLMRAAFVGNRGRKSKTKAPKESTNGQ